MKQVLIWTYISMGVHFTAMIIYLVAVNVYLFQEESRKKAKRKRREAVSFVEREIALTKKFLEKHDG